MRALLFLLVLLLTGCASIPNQGITEDVHWASHRDSVLGIAQWSAEGKAGARQGESSTSFNILWHQWDNAYEIHLFGPLGQGAVLITGDATQARLDDGNQVITAPDLQTLIAENHSIQLPLNALQYWIRGVPEPRQPATIALGTQGLIAELNQLGWTVEYADYSPTEPPMPRKFSLSRGDTTAKIIIKSWDLEPTP